MNENGREKHVKTGRSHRAHHSIDDLASYFFFYYFLFSSYFFYIAAYMYGCLYRYILAIFIRIVHGINNLWCGTCALARYKFHWKIMRLDWRMKETIGFSDVMVFFFFFLSVDTVITNPLNGYCIPHIVGGIYI